MIDSIYESSTYLVASKQALQTPEKKKFIDSLVMLLNSVLIGRQSVWIEFNVLGPNAKAHLEHITRWLPAMGAPTVADLYGREGFGVKSVVRKDELANLLPKVKLAGGTDIIVYSVSQVLP